MGGRRGGERLPYKAQRCLSVHLGVSLQIWSHFEMFKTIIARPECGQNVFPTSSQPQNTSVSPFESILRHTNITDFSSLSNNSTSEIPFIYLKPEKRDPFQVQHPCIAHYREYGPGTSYHAT